MIMTAKELMVDDYIYRPDCIDKVCEIRKNGIIGLDSLRGIISFSELEPIRLYPSTLKKIGFTNTEFYAEMLIDGWQIQCDGLHLKASNNEYSINIKCEYVHELQHTLKLCGIEKGIVI